MDKRPNPPTDPDWEAYYVTAYRPKVTSGYVPDNPPPRRSLVTEMAVVGQWYPDPWPRQRANQLVFAVPVTEPPRRTNTLTLSIIRQWDPPAPQPTQKRVEIVPLTLVYGDQPPRRSNVNLNTIVQNWVPPHHYDWRRPKFVFGVQVDQPPRLKLALINSLYQIAWTPPPPQPQRDLPTVIVSVDQPPRRRLVAPYYTVELVQPTQRQLTLTAGVVVAGPPPLKRLPESILEAWQGVVEVPVRRPAFTVGVTALPPYTGLPRAIYDAWAVAYDLPLREPGVAAFLPYTPLPADDPPIPTRHWVELGPWWYPVPDYPFRYGAAPIREPLRGVMWVAGQGA